MKSLGQVAYEKHSSFADPSGTWEGLLPKDRREWESVAQAVVKEHFPPPQSLINGPIMVDCLSRKVIVNGSEVYLPPKQYDVLVYLMKNAGRVVDHSKIMVDVWGRGNAKDIQYLRVMMKPLRMAIGDDPQDPKILVTQPGVGYRMEKLD